MVKWSRVMGKYGSFYTPETVEEIGEGFRKLNDDLTVEQRM